MTHKELAELMVKPAAGRTPGLCPYATFTIGLIFIDGPYGKQPYNCAASLRGPPNTAVKCPTSEGSRASFPLPQPIKQQVQMVKHRINDVSLCSTYFLICLLACVC